MWHKQNRHFTYDLTIFSACAMRPDTITFNRSKYNKLSLGPAMCAFAPLLNADFFAWQPQFGNVWTSIEIFHGADTIGMQNSICNCQRGWWSNRWADECVVRTCCSAIVINTNSSDLFGNPLESRARAHIHIHGDTEQMVRVDANQRAFVPNTWLNVNHLLP